MRGALWHSFQNQQKTKNIYIFLYWKKQFRTHQIQVLHVKEIIVSQTKQTCKRCLERYKTQLLEIKYYKKAKLRLKE